MCACMNVCMYVCTYVCMCAGDKVKQTYDVSDMYHYVIIHVSRGGPRNSSRGVGSGPESFKGRGWVGSRSTGIFIY